MGKIKKLFGKPKPPKMPKLPPPVDAEVERLKAENEATAKANADSTTKRKRRGSSLLTKGAIGLDDEAVTSSVLAKGKLGE